MNKRCRTCLSTERKLDVLMGTLHDLFSKFVPQISDNEKVLMCWECRANVRHIDLFCKKAQQAQQVFLEYNLKDSTSKYSNIQSKSSLGTTLTEVCSVAETNYDNTVYTQNLLQIPIKEELTEELFLDCGHDFQDCNLKGSPEGEQLSNIESKSNIGKKCNDTIDITLHLLEMPIKEETTRKLNLDFENESSMSSYRVDHDISNAPGTLVKSESTSKDDCGSTDSVTKIKKIQSPVKKRARKILDSYTCKVCGKVFDTRGKLYYHGSVHKTRPQCEECGVTFASANSLWKHNIRHSDVKKFTCDRCKGIFFTEAGYQAHMSNHGLCRDETYCSPCGMFFKTYKYLRKHQQTSQKHFDPETWIHSCTECDRKFPSPKIVMEHSKSIHADKKITCNQCTLKYCTERALRTHVKRTHNKVIKPKDKVCEFCGKGFQIWQVLKAHRRTHTGERPFSCSICSARFAHSGALHTHKKLVHQRIKRRRANKTKS